MSGPYSRTGRKRVPDEATACRFPSRRNLRVRASYSGVHYRILYFFYGKDAVALSHGITKEREVPAPDIDLAIKRMTEVRANPDKLTADIDLES